MVNSIKSNNRIFNIIKSTVLITSITGMILWVLWYKKSESSYKPRNKTQAEVIEKDKNGYYTDFYNSQITHVVNNEINDSIYEYNNTIDYSLEPPKEVLQLCKLPEVWWVHLPLPVSTTWEAFAGTLSRSIKDKNRDIYIPDYTSLLPKSAIAWIGSSAICITSARCFLSYHIGYPSNLTPQAYDFFSRQSGIRNNPDTKKSDWSVRYTHHFLMNNDIWYTSQDFRSIKNIKAGDMIFILYAGSNYKSHAFRDENPSTHIMIGVGKQSIQIPITMLQWININNNDEIIRYFINQRRDPSHNILSEQEFNKSKKRIQSLMPNLELPTVTKDKDYITITGDWTIDEFWWKMCFRLIQERLLQSSSIPWQQWFTFRPTTIRSLTNPSNFFKNPILYSKSLEFEKGTTSNSFIMPSKDGKWESVAEKILEEDSLNYENTLQWHRFLQTIHQPGIPLPIITDIDSNIARLIKEKLESDFPLQIKKRRENITTHNSLSNNRKIIEMNYWDTRNKLTESINTYILNDTDTSLSYRSKVTKDEKNTILSNLPGHCMRVFHSNNTFRSIWFWDTLQSWEQVIIDMNPIIQHIKKEIIIHKLTSLPSIPWEYHVLDYHINQSTKWIAQQDRPDIINILSGIATSETPWKEWEYSYKRKYIKYILEHYLWWYVISSQWPYQMRAKNYDSNNYLQTIQYLKSDEFSQHIKEYFHFKTEKEYTQYRKDNGGEIIDEMDQLLKDEKFTLRSHDDNYDAKKAAKFIDLFNDLNSMKFEYTDQDFLQLSFVSTLAWYDLIQKKKKITRNIASIISYWDEWKDKSEYIIELLKNSKNRRSIDELVRLMHHTGERAVYQKLIVVYIEQVMKERDLDKNPDQTIWQLPDYEREEFWDQYRLYIDAIYERLKEIANNEKLYWNSTSYAAKDFLGQLKTINLYSKKISDMVSIQKLVEIVHTRAKLTNKNIKVEFLPDPELLYTHNLFKDYIARADVDKSMQNRSILTLLISSWLLWLRLFLLSMEQFKKHKLFDRSTDYIKDLTNKII